jgi:hypothetical protein
MKRLGVIRRIMSSFSATDGLKFCIVPKCGRNFSKRRPLGTALHSLVYLDSKYFKRKLKAHNTAQYNSSLNVRLL